MPSITRSITGVLAAVAITALIGAAATHASARTIPVDIRVATSDGKTLVDQRQYTTNIAVRPSPRANCFGTGTGGSGRPVQVKGLTSLGVLAQAASTAPRLRPLLITDHDFGFPGLGMCGIGGPAPSDQYWFSKSDGKAAMLSGDQTAVRPRGSLLWYLMPFTACDTEPPYACPAELELHAPARARPGQSFQVRVTAVDDAGETRPAEGVRVTGAAGPTDARGRTTVELRRNARLTATAEGAIPSASLAVCVNERPASCPAARGLTIQGSQSNDRIVGTPGPDTIRTGPGNNQVNVRGGGRDRVICGNGRNVVIADRTDVVRGCTTVRRS